MFDQELAFYRIFSTKCYVEWVSSIRIYFLLDIKSSRFETSHVLVYDWSILK